MEAYNLGHEHGAKDERERILAALPFDLPKDELEENQWYSRGWNAGLKKLRRIITPNNL